MNPKIVHFITPAGPNKEGDKYLALLKQHAPHPSYRYLDRSVGMPFWLTGTADPEDPFGSVGVKLIKFRDGLFFVYIAQDEQGNWGVGPWLARPNFDRLEYFRDAKPRGSFLDALDDVYATRPRGFVRVAIWFYWAAAWLRYYAARAFGLGRPSNTEASSS